jgi:paraquat-inducible protein B
MKRHALLIGAFLATSVAVIVTGILWLSGGSLFETRTEAIIYFPSGVRGLYVGAPVTFRGVPVGEVQTIGVEMNPQTLAARIPVLVTLRPQDLRLIDDGKRRRPIALPELVQRGLRARLVAQSLVTGQKLIDLDFVPQSPATLLGDGSPPEIPTAKNQFDALLEQAGDLPVRDMVNELRSVVKEVDKTLRSARAVLDASQGQVQATGEQARQMLAASQTAVTELQRSTATTLHSVQQLSERARETVNQAGPELTATLRSARQATEAAQAALQEVQAVTAAGGTVRADLESSLRDLSAAARSLRDWSELVSDRPNAVIFGRERP